jgi:RHS repeat-associated protein
VDRWTLDTGARETDDPTAVRVRYELPDHLGSAELALDQSAQVISYEEYFPFGATAFVAGNAIREVKLRDYRFCGKERDDATGLDYFGHRYYAAWTGRWLSPDPIGTDDDSNLYRYCANNPVSLTDPDGLQSAAAQTVRRDGLHIQYSTPKLPKVLRGVRLTPEQVQQWNSGAIAIVRLPGSEKPTVMSRKEYDALVRRETAANRTIVTAHLVPRRHRSTPKRRPDPPPPPAPGSTGDPGSGGVGDAGTGAGAGGEGAQPGGRERGDDGTGGRLTGPDGNGAGSKGTSDHHGEGAGGIDGGDGAARSGRQSAGAGTGSDAGPTGGDRPRGRGPGGGTGQQGAGGDEPGGEPGGVPGGEPGGELGGVLGGELGGEVGGVPGRQGTGGEVGGEGGTSGTGLAPSNGSIPTPSDQTDNGDDPDGRRTGPGIGGRGPGRGRGQGAGAGSGRHRSEQPDAGGGGRAGGRGAAEPTALGTALTAAGWTQGEFGDDGDGTPGGIPGGTGSHPGGRGYQLLYIALAAIDVISTVVALAAKGGLKAITAGAREALAALAGVFNRKFWRGVRRRLMRYLTGRFWRSVWRRFTRSSFARFFIDKRLYESIRDAYWAARGGANGWNLHHWLFPRKWKWVPESVRNAGFNLVALPGWLNQWMGREYAIRSFGYWTTGAVTNVFRIAIPGSLIGGAYGGWRAGGWLVHWSSEPTTNPRDPQRAPPPSGPTAP